MAEKLVLERFPSAATGSGAPQEAAADDQLQVGAFEKGYRSGWDDATAARSHEEEPLLRDLQQIAQQLEADHQALRAALVAEFGELALAMIRQCLAPLADELSLRRMRRAVEEILEEAPAAKIRLRVPRPLYERLLDDPAWAARTELTAEDCAEDGQGPIRLSWAGQELSIETGAFITALESLLSEHLTETGA
ncbi:hypothetical protein [Mangrovicoccus algicola]|uniref:Uncharacterized protein n=1 Tax=Mangrovicoccus algicola TaxID=2771008 RepID=A0A8J6YXP8_9RHOB|nr:hypothetical protein [Mangrovicoccus algicola]MBE3638404.1 hypothetical protein [Mangrovicoccus algicola]